MSLGDAAANLGLPCFPCAPDKRPVVPTGYKAASAERARILAMFEQPGAALIGVPTGAASGLIVVDVDIKNGQPGMAWLDENREALPETRTHRTQSGGLHLVFRAPPGIEIRNSASRVAPGVDVRGEGGYVCFPPSPGYAVADAAPPADMPQWLIRACLAPETAPSLPPARSRDPVPAYAARALNDEAMEVMRAGEGTRNDRLNIAAVKLGTLVGAGLLARADVESDLTRAAQTAGLDPREIAATLKSGLEFGIARPRAIPERPERHMPAEMPPATPDDPGYYAAQDAEASMSSEEWDDLERRETGRSAPASPEARAKAGPDLLWSITDPWDEAAIPTRPWVARGYLMRGAVTVVSGPGSAGKSSLMVAWATAAAIGSAFHHFKPDGPLRVATYNVEDDGEEQKRRFSAMLRQLKLGPADLAGRLAILGPTRVGTLLQTARDGTLLVNTPVMDKLEAFVTEFRPDVLILDPFVELHAAEENDNTAIRAVLAKFRAMAVEHAMSVVLLHHARKGAGSPGDPDSLRGASSIVGAARVALTLNVMTDDEAQTLGIPADRRRDYFRLDGAKSNYAKIEAAEWFERVEIALANSDGVAVAWPWKPPSVFRDTTPAGINAVLDKIACGPEPGVRFTASRQGGAQHWAGTVLITDLGITDKQAKAMIAQWLKSGLLYERQYTTPDRKIKHGVEVDDAHRPS